MALTALLVAVGMMYLWETQGSNAVTTVFVQKGKNLHLDVNKPVVLPKGEEFKWTYNNKHNLVRLRSGEEPRKSQEDSYKGRVEFSEQNHSLLLKNVQHNDSGDYTALITGDTNQPLAEYKVIIQDPVSPAQLSVNSVSNSTESCNLTVTCSTEDSLINSTFRCDTQTCNQEGGEQSKNTTSASSLRVYLFNGSIICNHSNQVSWTSNMTKIQHFCPLTAGTPGFTTVVIVIVIFIVFIIVIGILFFLVRQKNQQKRENSENATYQEINPSQTPNQTATEDASGLSPNSTYALVGIPAAPVRSTETVNTPKPESVYAQVT
ncbi:SLAM family member 5-like [Scomber scombrus]|uniref:SLAM family member 5-like n=1 Tax=Scomber scombrus TaxID=13677 RepID=A0AAV1QNR2_SCOSC